MHSSATYHVAKDANDYRYIHQFIRDQGEEAPTLTFPTVAAVDIEGTIVGVMGTHLQKDLIIGGPLLIDKNLRGYRIIVNLINTYDTILASLGITSYIFSADKNDKRWLKYVDEVYGIEPYAEKEGLLFFVKKIG